MFQNSFNIFLCRIFGVLTLVLGTLISNGVPFALAEETSLSPKALQQIQALIAEKSKRTPIQQKVSSRLLHQEKMMQGEAITEGIQSLQTQVTVDSLGTTLIDIKATVTPEVLTHIESIGGTVLSSFPQYQAIRARIPLHQCSAIAKLPEVKFIRPAEEAMIDSHDIGAVNVTEGDVAHLADQARATFGIDGTGVTIGVLSDSVDFLGDVQASGDLPVVTVLPGQSGLPGTGEGTAMLEIVHDLAPGANLLFARAFGGQATFANNILALRTAGADVIVDDIRYFEEPAFQDGIIAQAVNQVTADGAIYFASQGNDGNLNAGRSGVWEGDFSPTVAPAVLGNVIAHNFGSGNFNQITGDSPSFITLQWSDPMGGSANDYDLFLLDSTGTNVVAVSNDVQNGTQNPFEHIDSKARNDLNNRIVIVQFFGDSRYLRLSTHRGELSVGTDGAAYGHSSSQSAIAVGAVNAAAGLPFVGGPTNPIENFSSDGPRQVFFQEDGTPITPGNFSSTGGTVIQKPDFTAANRVSTATPGFSSFAGTSAAVPHAAGIAALLLEQNPGLTGTQLENILIETALDIEAPGVDRDSGFGIIDALGAVSHLPTLTVTVAGSGAGQVTSNPAGILCGQGETDCMESYPIGQVVNLMTLAEFESTFVGFTGDEDCEDGVVTMDASISCEATFELDENIEFPNVVGTYAVEGSLPRTACSEPNPFGIFPLSGFVIINDQVGKNFSGRVVFVHETLAASQDGPVTGEVDIEGRLTGDFVIDLLFDDRFDRTTKGFISGVFFGDELIMNFLGQDIVGGTCAMEGNVTGELSSAAYTLSITKVGMGTVEVVNGPFTVECGEECRVGFPAHLPLGLAPSLDPNFIFAGYTGDPDCADGAVVMDANKSCIATFIPLVGGPIPTQELLWAKQGGGPGMDEGGLGGVDGSGNSYVGGGFEGEATFGPGTMRTSLGERDIFLAKYDANGNVVWVKQEGSENDEFAGGAVLDRSGNLFAGGAFQGSLTFGEVGNESTIVSGGGIEGWLGKFDPSNGNLIWVKRLGPTNLHRPAFDDAGNMYLTGSIQGTVTLFPDDTNGMEVTSSGGKDTYFAKLDPNGDVVWIKQAGGPGDIESRLTTDALGNSYAFGDFTGDVTLGQGEGNETPLTSEGARDIFLAKLNPSGELDWIKQAGGAEDEESDGIVLDDTGNIYVIGGFGDGSPNSETLILGQGEANVTTLTSVGLGDVFLAKYDPSGMLMWAKQAGGPGYDDIEGLAVDSLGSPYVYGDFGGQFGGSATFGLGEFRVTVLTSVGGRDIYLAKYEPNGDLAWARREGGLDDEESGDLAIDGFGQPHISGTFTGSSTFGLGESHETTLISAGETDFFIAKFGPLQHTLMVNKDGSGTGTVTTVDGVIDCGVVCEGDFTDQQLVEFTFTPDPGSFFAGLSGHPSCFGNTVLMDASKTCIATFEIGEPPGDPVLSVVTTGPGTGIVSSAPAGISCPGDCSEALPFATNVTLTASPDPGSVFLGWTGCFQAFDNPLECTVFVTQDETVTARFGVDTGVSAQVSFAVSRLSITEDGGSIPIVVTRTGIPNGLVSVDVIAAIGSPVEGVATQFEDYDPLPAQILTWDAFDFAPQTIFIPILDDTLEEGNETFILTLSSLSDGAVIGANSSMIITIIDTDSPSPSSALAGEWHGQSYGDIRFANFPNWVNGMIEVNAFGTVVGSTLTTSDGVAVSIVSGALALNPDRTVTGWSTFGNGVTSVFEGSLDAQQTLMAGVTMGSNNSRDLTMFMKKGETFSQSDLASTWHVQSLGDSRNVQSPVGVNGHLTFDNGGAVTDSHILNTEGGMPEVTGTLTLDPDGSVSGSLVNTGGPTFDSVGAMDAQKTIMSRLLVSPENSRRVLNVLIKEGTGFTPQDLAGMWKLFIASDVREFNNPVWIQATLTVDDNGNIVEGHQQVSEGPSLAITSGTIGFNAEEELVGLWTLENGVTIHSTGSLDINKTFAATVGTGTAGINTIRNMALWVKQDPPASLDVDGNGEVDALTDGMLILRYLFGFKQAALINGVLALDAVRTTPEAILEYLDSIRDILLDVDGNGEVDAFTDGMLIARFMMGFTGDSLINQVIDPSGTRASATKVIDFLSPFLPGFVAAEISVDTSPFDFTIVPGEIGNITTTVSLTTTVSGPFNVVVTQQVNTLSGPDEGIDISPDIVGGFSTRMDHATVDNQEITAISEGVYEIVTTAEIIETGEVVESVAVITVETHTQTLGLGIPGSEPGGLVPDTSTPVVFTVQVHGADPETPVEVELGGGLTLTLNDEGIDGDLAEEDGTFSGTTVVDTTGMAVGSCLAITATVLQGAETQISEPYKLCVSSLPMELSPSDLTNTIIDPVSGAPAVANEILIIVVPGTADAVIMQMAASVGGTIVGSIPGLDVYQIRLQSPVSNSSELAQFLTDLEAFEVIVSAEANTLSETTAVTPSDPQFASQKGVVKIRADEAWTIARGNVTIAIVDSGVDLDHPDLASKVIKGKDFVDGDTNPDDEHGHGTHVAGIAAAVANNGIGIAGVAWNSKLFVVRLADSAGRIADADVTAAIKHAADMGARIINTSLGGAGGKISKCLAVFYAKVKGSMVIAAAGNNGNSTEFYPAACPGAIAVGNTTDSDARNGSSNFGSWVDLAAPGTNILSTVPVGGTCRHCNATGYKRLTGTSMASPMVAGAAAVVLSRESKLTNAEVKTRLERTAVKLPATAQLGAGRIDLFEAVFNGSFEEGNLALWERQGTASSKKSLGAIMPQDRDRMGSVSTGPADAQIEGALSQRFTIQPDVAEFTISFKYAFISEEYPEFVNTIFDDSLRIKLIAPGGESLTFVTERVNASDFSPISGFDFPGGDFTIGWTGWKSASFSIPGLEGPGTYQIMLEDAGDAIYDTETLIDDIKFK